MGEHRVIEQVLGCLEKMANGCVLDKTLDADAAYQAIDFFKGFCDSCHHAKEEEHLFPTMEAKGFSRTEGPTAVMRYEHEQARRYLQGMKAVIDKAAAGDALSLWRFAEQAWCYIELLRHHITKEDQRLFALADEHLTDADQQALLEGFVALENRDHHAAAHEKYLDIADELAKRFGVPRNHCGIAAIASAGGCGYHP
jgi:hemerythrin-like domain-containing protein